MKIYALVIYDIVNDKRRAKFAKRLNQYGIRVQKSAMIRKREKESMHRSAWASGYPM